MASQAQEAVRLEALSGADHVLERTVVTSLVRSGDGFLWVGTTEGLVRFEGVRARDGASLTAGTPRTSLRWITAQLPDPRQPGSVWIVSQSGSLFHFDAASGLVRETGFSSEGGRPSTLAWWGDRLVVGTSDAGAFEFDPASESTRRLTADRGLPLPDSIAGIAASTSDQPLWLATTSGLYKLTPEPDLTVTLVAEGGITALALESTSLWAGRVGGRVLELNLETGRVRNFRAVPDEIRISALEESRQRPGTVWVSSRGAGLLRLDAGTGAVSAVHTVTSGDSGQRLTDVTAVMEDRSGLLWVGSVGGLYRGDLKLPRFKEPTNLPGDPDVMSLLQSKRDPATVWAGTVRSGLYAVRDGVPERFPGTESGALSFVYELYEDSRGRLWAGTERVGLYEIDRTSRRYRHHPLGLTGGVIHSIEEVPFGSGTLMISSRGGGLLEYDTGREIVTRAWLPSTTGGRFSDDDVYFSIPTKTDSTVLWVGTFNEGLWRLDTKSGDIARFPSSSCDFSSAIAAHDDGNHVWVGTYLSGLIRISLGDGVCTQWTVANGLPNRGVGAIHEDASGRLWLTTNSGLAVLHSDRETITSFGIEDGLVTDNLYWPATHAAADGSLFVGGALGYSEVEPNRVWFDTAAPAVFVTDLLVDGLPRTPTRQTLQPTENDIEIRFAVSNLRRPDLARYRLRLGPSEPWQYPESITRQRFPRLEPGDYLLQVHGANGDGFWSREPATLPLTILQPFWRRWYVQLSVLLLTAAVIVAAFQYRLVQLRRVEQTRRRIADDLHDDIGSKLSAVTLGMDLAQRRWQLKPDEQQEFRHLTVAAREVVGDLKDNVWIVDAGQDDLSSTIARMEHFAHQILKGRDYQCSIPDIIPDRSVGMEWRRHVFLLFKEALTNAARHSQAESIELVLGVSLNSFEFEIRDDGVGLGPAPLQGRGLQTMQRRAEAVDGVVHVSSAGSRGTRVVFSGPLPAQG